MKIVKILLLTQLLTLVGCVTGTRSLENLNVPAYSNETSASGQIFISDIMDSRQFEQKPEAPSTPSVKGKLSQTSKATLSTLIGRQRNGYGAAMGDVALPEGQNVQGKMKELLTVGLESRGYTVVDDRSAPNQVSVDISKFWAWFSPGFASVSFESNLECKIEFEGAKGKKTLEVAGYGVNKGQVASNANWELAFHRAFEDFLEKLDAAMDAEGL